MARWRIGRERLGFLNDVEGATRLDRLTLLIDRLSIERLLSDVYSAAKRQRARLLLSKSVLQQTLITFNTHSL